MKLFSVGLMAVLLIVPFKSQADSDESFFWSKDSVLNALILEAMENNPEIANRTWNIEASRHAEVQAGELPDPMASLGFMNLPVNTFKLNQEPMTAIWLNASQSFSISGKYGLKGEIAKLSTEQKFYEKAQTELSLIEAICHSWYDWAYNIDAITETEETISLSENILKALIERYAAGNIHQSDLILLEVKISQLQAEKLQFEQTAQAIGRRLAVLLGRDSGNIPQAPAGLSAGFASIDREKADRELIENNTMIMQMKRGLEKAKVNTDLAKALWYPDFTVGGGYGFRQDAESGMSRPDFFSLSISSSLPIFGDKKQRQKVEESKADLKASEERLRSTELMLDQKLSTLIDEDERLGKQIALYTSEVIPQAEAAYSSVESDYGVGRVDIVRLLTADKMVLDSKLKNSKLIRDRSKVRASISALITKTGSSSNANEQNSESSR